MSRSYRKNDIPDRWQDYNAVGKRLKGTRFIAFKVPLKQALTRMLSSSDVFGPWELLDALKKDNQELGLIIDLTFTTRYYTLQDVPQSLMVIKILTAGHEVPDDNTILSFKRAVHRFLRDNKDNDKLIGVHCTHGLNRTGYLICRYLIDMDGMAPAEAVELFNSSRGHAIERQNYLEDLYYGPKRSNKGIEESQQEPQRGQAVHRPAFTPSDSRSDTQASFSGPGYHRSHLSQPKYRCDPYYPQHAHLPRPPLLSHLPRPPLLAHPPLGIPPSTSFHPYRWTPPHSDNRSRYQSPPDPQWPPSFALQDRGGAPLPLFPRYFPNWTPVPNGDRSAKGQSRSTVRHPDTQTPRYSQGHRANTYDRY